MRKLLHAALLFCLFTLAGVISAPNSHAAPGDFLFLFGAQQHLKGALGIAVDANDNVYVTMPDNIQVFNSSGIRTKKWGNYGSGDGQFSYPNGIAVDATGRVYVADTGNGRVQVFDSSGAFLGKWSDPTWASRPPIGIASDGKGQVYVAESGENGMVKVFDSAGKYLRMVGTEDGIYTQPGGVAVDADGNVYVVDSYLWQVLVYAPDGTFLRAVAEGYSGIAVGTSGNIYTVCFDPWGNWVMMFDSAGNSLKSFGSSFGPDQDYEGERFFWSPHSVAVDSKGNVYTLDGGDGLRAFDTTGTEMPQWWTYGARAGEMSRPQGIATDSRGNVYETDGHDEDTGIYNNRVQIFNRDGQSIGKWTIGSAGQFRQTSGINIDDSGNVYVLETVNLDTWNDRMWPGSIGNVFDPSGNFLRLVAPLIPCDFLDGQCAAPYGIATDKSGNALVTNGYPAAVSVYDSTGKFLRGIESPEGLNNPRGIAVDRNGNVYIVDTGNSRVQVFGSNYAFIRKWGSPGSGDGQFSAPAGIAVDGGGHVFVADTGNNRIQVFDNSGSFLKKWGGEGDDNGLFRSPEGVAVDRAGTRVYVADTGSNRIQVFEGYGTAGPFALSGSVRQGTETGPVLPGATVSIAGKTAITSSTGTFSITGIPAGTYTLTISRTGYVTKTIAGYEITSDSSGLTFYLTRVTYSLSGTVRKGSVSGAVLSGVTVSIAGRRATTASDGTFTVTGIPSGSYTLYLSKTGYVSKSITGYAVNSDRSGVVFYLTPATHTISGTVRQGSSTGPVLSGATVSIGGKSTTTGSTGTFSIAGIPTGTYAVTISKPGFVTKTVPGLFIDRNRSGLLYFLIKK